MQRQGAAAFGGFLLVLWAVLSAVGLAKGGFYVSMHEGDTIHLVDIVLREAAGEWPHLDFMSPIGYLATAPIALFASMGWGVGMSILASQVLVGALLLLPIWWVGISRLPFGWAVAFGAICLVLTLALVHGEAEPLASISMHYNRWAWALSFLAIAIAVLPPVNRQGSIADGVICGLAIAALAMIKVTYVAAFLPVVTLALLLRRDWMALLAATLAGLAVVAIFTLAAGPDFWSAYFGDLLDVKNSEMRSKPGLGLSSVLSAPAYLGGSIVAVAAVVLLRQGGRDREGLLLLLLFPGFAYVTYQNYGNDPQWIYLLGLLLFALAPDPGTTNARGWDMRNAVRLAGAAAFVIGLPTALNLAFSPLRHLTLDAGEFQPMFPGSDLALDDMYVHEERWQRPVVRAELDVVGVDFSDLEEDVEPTILNGAVLENCDILSGSIVLYDAIARDMEAAGFGGSKLFVADLLTGYWLFGDFERLRGAAPWRYDGLPGIETADHVLVPLCPIHNAARQSTLSLLAEGGYGLEERHRTESYIVLGLTQP
ncbi:hypothetical protein CLV78_102291 [Aliiruegeria haliotis]|uniref:DUF2029 domain-containing protein n=1 Tax=Aliiruegeria haliotis TaxID=1280846 RepID=A0A2T0RVC4_9RHOB|nr:glycosyltransferase family 87 protein [Aliiruegeria haliotis]PRY25114.1 hypothetical protein CLV78_102291 [Aliiruegeria haliotis]